MAKYSEKLVQKIVLLIEEDSYSISEICAALGISRKSFYEWKRSNPDFSLALGEAMDVRDDRLLMRARKSLQKKIDGYTLVETKTTYVPDEDDPSQLKIKNRVVKQKEYAPDNSTIKLILTRSDKGGLSKIDTDVESKILPFNITVTDQKTADAVQLLQQRGNDKSVAFGINIGDKRKVV